jgi:hypothetical protein
MDTGLFYLTQAGSKILPPAGLGASRRLGTPIPMPRIGALRLNLLSTQNQILITRKRKNTPAPFRGLAYFIGSGGALR